MKVYQIITEPYQDFCFYSRNGILTLCSDHKFPHVAGNSMYDGKTKRWIKINNPMSKYDTTVYTDGPNIGTLVYSPDKVICPSWFVKKQFYIEHVKEQLDPLLETSLSTYGDEPFNLFVFKKEIKKNKDMLSIGMCGRTNLKGIRCHPIFTKHCHKILNLKAFW